MKEDLVKSIRLTYSAGVIVLLLSSGLAGCSMYGYPDATPRVTSSTGKDTMPTDQQAAPEDEPYISGE
jgi:hypothetical protein